ncbi:MAG: hypothetical protein IJW55_07740 [Clostridia bacterium]|nr:hypothetical protein [Clostridia bacterium]
MKYQNLNELIQYSLSSRQFFLSQSVAMQLTLTKHSEYIHTAADLHQKIDEIKSYERTVRISKLPLFSLQSRPHR